MGASLQTHWRTALALTLLFLAAVGAGYAFWPRPAPPLAISTPTPRPTASPAPLLVVHVVGAVRTPGVYRLPAGSRAEDAVALAGGLLEDAEPASLNLAARLVDGQQVVVKSRAASPEATGDGGPRGKINLNQASLAELDTLPGIGPTTAQRIADRRQRLGPFQAIEQLRDEKLVTNATYERIKDLVSVD